MDMIFRLINKVLYGEVECESCGIKFVPIVYKNPGDNMVYICSEHCYRNMFNDDNIV